MQPAKQKCTHANRKSVLVLFVLVVDWNEAALTEKHLLRSQFREVALEFGAVEHEHSLGVEVLIGYARKDTILNLF